MFLTQPCSNTKSKQQSLWCLLWCFWKEMLWPYLEILHFASTQNPLVAIEHSKSVESIFSSKKKKDLVKFQTSLCSFHVVSKLLEKLVSLLSSLIIMCFCTRIVRRRIIKQEAKGNVNSHNSQACTFKYASLFYWENLLAIVDFRKWSNLKWILHFISFQKAFVSFRLLQILIPQEMFR